MTSTHVVGTPLPDPFVINGSAGSTVAIPIRVKLSAEDACLVHKSVKEFELDADTIARARETTMYQDVDSVAVKDRHPYTNKAVAAWCALHLVVAQRECDGSPILRFNRDTLVREEMKRVVVEVTGPFLAWLCNAFSLARLSNPDAPLDQPPQDVDVLVCRGRPKNPFVRLSPRELLMPSARDSPCRFDIVLCGGTLCFTNSVRFAAKEPADMRKRMAAASDVGAGAGSGVGPRKRPHVVVFHDYDMKM
jgi:hypothetical protein